MDCLVSPMWLPTLIQHDLSFVSFEAVCKEKSLACNTTDEGLGLVPVQFAIRIEAPYYPVLTSMHRAISKIKHRSM